MLRLGNRSQSPRLKSARSPFEERNLCPARILSLNSSNCGPKTGAWPASPPSSHSTTFNLAKNCTVSASLLPHETSSPNGAPSIARPERQTAPASKCKTGQKQGKNRATFLGRKQYGEWFFAKRTHLGVERRCPHRHGPIRHSTVLAPRPWPAKLHSFCLTFAS